jgi:hypothetical protein
LERQWPNAPTAKRAVSDGLPLSSKLHNSVFYAPVNGGCDVGWEIPWQLADGAVKSFRARLDHLLDQADGAALA